jgi:hypothetical protein
MHFKEICHEFVICIGYVAHDRLGSCDYDNDPSGSKKDGEFIVQLNEFQFLKCDSVAWSYLGF